MFEDLAAAGGDPSQLHLDSDKLTEALDGDKLLQQAGLADIHVRTQQLGCHLQSFEDWWAIIWNSGARRLVNQLQELATDYRQQTIDNRQRYLDGCTGVDLVGCRLGRG